MKTTIRLRKKYFFDFFTSIFIFMTISIPSLKLIYSTQLINIICFCSLALLTVIKFRIHLTYENKYLLFFWFIFSVLLLFTVFYGAFDKEFDYFIELFYFIFILIFIIILSNYNILIKAGRLIFFWGMFIAIWQLTFGINTNIDAGQHYLTVSMPLGAALAYTTRFFFSTEDNWEKRLFFAISFFVIFIALSTLLSRSAFIFNFLILILFFLSYIFINKNMTFIYKLISVFILSISIITTYSYFSDKIEFRQVDRFDRLVTNTDSEPRISEKYLPAINYISSKPIFGYGMGASKGLYGNYPHNIFLEVLSIGGIILLFPFLFILILYFKVVYLILKYHLNNSYLVGGSAFSLFFFLQFNSSFPLTSAYIPIGSMVLLIIGFYDFKKIHTSKTQ